MQAARRVLHDDPEYVQDRLAAYKQRQADRTHNGTPVLMLCGHGGAGKDFAAEYLCQSTPMVYSGSTSNVVAPLIAKALGSNDVKSTFESRKQNREFWYAFCNEVRRDDPTLLAKLNLAAGDVVVGPRDSFEVYHTIEQGIVDLSVWIDNPRVAQDPTIKFGPDDCDITICNSGSRFAFYRKLDKLISQLPLSSRTKCPTPTE